MNRKQRNSWIRRIWAGALVLFGVYKALSILAVRSAFGIDLPTLQIVYFFAVNTFVFLSPITGLLLLRRFNHTLLALWAMLGCFGLNVLAQIVRLDGAGAAVGALQALVLLLPPFSVVLEEGDSEATNTRPGEAA